MSHAPTEHRRGGHLQGYFYNLHPLISTTERAISPIMFKPAMGMRLSVPRGTIRPKLSYYPDIAARPIS